MPKNEDPKIGLERYWRKAKFPFLKGPVSRKPLRGLRPKRGAFVFRRRGIRIPQDRRAELERRAISRARVYGTLIERIVYKEFTRRRFDFDFQSSLLGGRQITGGRVADFILYMPYGPIIVRVQSFAFHSGVAARRKDAEDKRILETLIDPVTQKKYIVYDLWEDVILSPERLAEWIDRNLLGNYQGQGLRAPRAEVDWMPKQEDWDAVVAQVQRNSAMLSEVLERLDTLWLGLATGDVVPEITMSEENIEANAITANKIDVATLSAIVANMGTLTAGSINMFTGTWDSNAEGFRLNADEIAAQNGGGSDVLKIDNSGIVATAGSFTAQRIKAGSGTKDSDLTGIQMDADEIVGQAAGVDQFYLRAADGKAYFGAGAITADSTGLKWYDSTPTQRGQILSDGSGWLGASDKFSWTTAGVVSLDGATITQKSARVWHDADQSINAETETVLAFNSEKFDRGDLHDTVTNNSRLTAPVAGRYLIIAHIGWESDNTGWRQLGIKLNGTTGLGYVRQSAANTGNDNQSITTMYDLAADDYVEALVKQDNDLDAALDVKSWEFHSPSFMMMRIGGS